jgi:hypothetical protein
MNQPDKTQFLCQLLGIKNLSLTPIHMGGNNKLFRIQGDERPLIAKWYFKSPADSRDRLHSEWSFLQYAHACGIANIPEPVAIDHHQNMAVYSYIDGTTLNTEPDIGHVMAAAKFIYKLNPGGKNSKDLPLPDASEAEFSFSAHVSSVANRIRILQDAIPLDDASHEARELVSTLHQYHHDIKQSILARCTATGIGFDDILPRQERCISPSDFGFHNAIIDDTGTISFIDFEYAGWDDPAKLICDFFWQPEIRVPAHLKPEFFKKAMQFTNQPEFHQDRIQILNLLFGLKWCCIMMNAHVPEWASRQTFAKPSLDIYKLKRIRLNMASLQLDVISKQLQLSI